MEDLRALVVIQFVLVDSASRDMTAVREVTDDNLCKSKY